MNKDTIDITNKQLNKAGLQCVYNKKKNSCYLAQERGINSCEMCWCNICCPRRSTR